jgi:phosphohistidine phosphatase
MKKLLLIRHAKSSWDNPLLPDHQRPLSKRGLRDAPEMGKRLVNKKVTPDLILSSDAVRAMHTALLIAKELVYPKSKVDSTREMYHASAKGILSVIRGTSPTIETLFLVGHNPGINDLISLFGEEIENLPTSGQFGFLFDVEDWENTSPKNAHFWFFDYPKLKPPHIL